MLSLLLKVLCVVFIKFIINRSKGFYDCWSQGEGLLTTVYFIEVK